MYSISINRPVYIVFDIIRLELVQEGDVLTKSFTLAAVPLVAGSQKIVVVKPIKREEEGSIRLFVELDIGVASSMQVNLLKTNRLK